MKHKKTALQIIKEYLVMGFGTVVYSIGLNLFVGPHGIAPGGVTGFAVVLYTILGVPIYLTNLAINIPLFIYGLRVLGKETGIKTLYATAVLTIALGIIPMDMSTSDVLLSGIFGGVIMGLGIGLVFYYGGTTGGTDLMGAILNKFFPNFKPANLMLAADFVVVLLAGIASRDIEVALYSVLCLYIIGRAVNLVLEGFGYSIAFYVISDYSDEIAAQIIKEIDRGVTALHGRGMYTNKERDLLLVVVSRSQFARVKDIILDIDERAFVMTAEMKEVLGEGFTYDPID